MTKRLLHCISSCNPKGGGPISGVNQLAKLYGAEGIEMEAATLDVASDRWVRESAFVVHALGPGRLGGYGLSLNYLRWLYRNAPRYDGVVVNGLWQFHAFACALVLAVRGVPYVVFTHGMLDPWFKRTYPLKHIKKWLLWPWSEYWLLRRARAVIFTSEEERVVSRKSFWLYRANEVVTGYGTLRPSIDKARAKEHFLGSNDLRDRKVLLFLGRIHEKKGFDLLLNAISRVVHSRPDQTKDLVLVVVGPDDDGYAKEMKDLCDRLSLGTRVKWLGLRAGEEKWAAISSAGAFILPSHQETSALPLLKPLRWGFRY